MVPIQPKFEIVKREPYRPLHCPDIHSMHTSKIREIVALLSPLYDCEMLKKMPKFG
jgi:vancomycin permeability regulator SanA